jgi:TetR/AcrR family fatty acid metabolism transcriptional regulator
VIRRPLQAYTERNDRAGDAPFRLDEAAAQRPKRVLNLPGTEPMAARRPKRTTYRLSRDERMSEIMSVTRQMLAEMGYKNITTLEIAQRCHLSEGAIFRHFPTKRDLLIKVAEAWFEELLSVDEGDEAETSPRERLRREIGYALSIIRKEPTLTRYVLMELRPDPEYRSMHLYQLNRQFTNRIRNALTAAVASGDLRSDVSVDLLRDMIFGSIEHQTWAFLRDEGDFDVEAAAEGITTVIWRGMQTARDTPHRETRFAERESPTRHRCHTGHREP